MKAFLKRILDAKPTMYSRSVLLNVLGWHFVRILFFDLRRRLRPRIRIDARFKNYLNELEKEGVVVIPDFFPPEEYELIRSEYKANEPHLRLTEHDTEILLPHVERLSLHDRRVDSRVRDLFIKNPLINAISASFLNRPFRLPIEAYFVKISVNEDELSLPKNGGTNNLHFDAPLRVFKVFYYINDTTVDQGPFTYCKGSAKRASLKRLLFEYRLSVRFALNRFNPENAGEYLNDEPWVKITPEEMREQGLLETKTAAKGNTLVLANTGGFHRRGEFTKAGARETVEINFRAVESLRNSFADVIGATRSVSENVSAPEPVATPVPA